MWGLSSQLEIELTAPVLEVWDLDHQGKSPDLII